ncbi:tetratricopeptide repeat protein [uncultured Sanguibacteroides sp.]|uniref:tetratricopeptide repeat protein n=1 Tax=uncultured Sanguibacteroides sp. TaxID=1635151 RepID=UPI0025F2F26A|nr:tetratricopeptide repeat protein [uncultured Sanguibacteroides sp.]
MRKLSFIIALLLCANFTFAQKGKVTSAVSFFTQGKLDKAKELIDEAIVHENCVSWPKAYFVKGQIYQAIYESQNPDYLKLVKDPLNIAWEAFQQVIKLDDKGKFKKDLINQYANLVGDFQNYGVEIYNRGVDNDNNANPDAAKKDFIIALDNFKRVLEINASEYGSQKVDTAIIFNSGITAQRAGDLEQALDFYKKALELNYDASKIYPMIISILFTQSKDASDSGDSVLGKKYQEEAVQYLLKGHELFPNESYLLIQLINYYLQGDTPEKAEKFLDAAIEQTPDNSELYRAKGDMYETLKQTDKAEAMYLKTLELNPNDFRAQYNLGNIQLQKVIVKHKEIDELNDAEYEAAYSQLLNEYESVIPYFERALELEPGEKNTLITLKELYYRLRDKPNTDYMKKYEKTKEMLDNL